MINFRLKRLEYYDSMGQEFGDNGFEVRTVRPMPFELPSNSLKTGGAVRVVSILQILVP